MLPLVQEWRSRSAEAKAEAEKAGGGESQEKGNQEPKASHTIIAGIWVAFFQEFQQ